VAEKVKLVVLSRSRVTSRFICHVIVVLRMVALQVQYNN